MWEGEMTSFLERDPLSCFFVFLLERTRKAGYNTSQTFVPLFEKVVRKTRGRGEVCMEEGTLKVVKQATQPLPFLEHLQVPVLYVEG
jgi:hypothetical protein